ncbi:DNA-binding response regulator [bacterium (Candidatus Blackallbacteria) CG17_big_fil_post_rev_8_21_14_2_50_48_46]|uniref:DNA-binding response regulator n=1 Tax=bacterium (Candidatus Blackallbacteria) CG17_big_fil_post_rev_8_21_14_2_50_48_46 TaxID=2014261 RepID=A0A2M7G7Y9_9BACT|nr:MAG: DNA-binding response regulator [bacterium (Candidatus Blackallbacteria) CG18_big_fil_WC_8_21_14_2_50_49_26]PIW18200.1 MAG: DNA-binding response regulator [bacterium (Candidatus Blackallbacteria) CG17_big_fil_post_rev_8_21_14_2_50_48_46]PIW50631.1 MAG: DNA-binding response regulator [bacterium (Candidatus Blackallbacteria) CG13_big_fil_rev_8_21_14_2_50_49_14]
MNSLTAAKILLIEDEAQISRFIELELKCEGYQVECANNGISGLTLAREKIFDLIILDRMLPGIDGMEICRRLRRDSQIPILMLTARSEVQDRVEGLDSGANDYLTKPFHLEELLARIRLQLRLNQNKNEDELAFEHLRLNLRSREVFSGEIPLHLAPREFELLALLMQNPRTVLTRSHILSSVWGWGNDVQESVLDVYIHALREKTEQTHQPRLIQTVRGIGYILKESP